MQDIERLIALENIKQLRARYCRYIDEHRWDDLRAVLSRGCRLDLSGVGAAVASVSAAARPPVEGREAIVAFLRDRFDGWKKVLHLCTMPDITFLSQDAAKGIWRQETYIKEGYPDQGETGIAYATVHDEYVREDGRWHIDAVQVILNIVL